MRFRNIGLHLAAFGELSPRRRQRLGAGQFADVLDGAARDAERYRAAAPTTQRQHRAAPCLFSLR
jgi:hypothetical protein